MSDPNKKYLPEIEFENKWLGLTPREIVDLMNGFNQFWCIAGGWALDLFMNKTTRSHEDLDILIFKKDLPEFREYFADWDLYLCDPPGSLRVWMTEDKCFDEISQGWARQSKTSKWALDILFVESSPFSFVYKRDVNLHFLLNKSVMKNAEGIPYLAPEIQLFHKAKSLREKDEKDLLMCLESFNQSQIHWLRMMIFNYFGAQHGWLKYFQH